MSNVAVILNMIKYTLALNLELHALCTNDIIIIIIIIITRQLSYRKEDRAMRPIDGCPEKF